MTSMHGRTAIHALGLGLLLAVQMAAAGEIKLEHRGMTLNAQLERAGESWPRGPVVLMTHGTLMKKPTIVFAGSEDQVIEGLAARVAPLAGDQQLKLVVIDGADHYFRDLYADEIVVGDFAGQ